MVPSDVWVSLTGCIPASCPVFMRCSWPTVTLNWITWLLKMNEHIGMFLKCFAGFHQHHHWSRSLLVLKVQRKGVCLWRMEKASSNWEGPRNLTKKAKWVFKDTVGLLSSDRISFTNLKSYCFWKENIAPAVEGSSNDSSLEEARHCREITEKEIQDIWKNVALTQ